MSDNNSNNNKQPSRSSSPWETIEVPSIPPRTAAAGRPPPTPPRNRGPTPPRPRGGDASSIGSFGSEVYIRADGKRVRRVKKHRGGSSSSIASSSTIASDDDDDSSRYTTGASVGSASVGSYIRADGKRVRRVKRSHKKRSIPTQVSVQDNNTSEGSFLQQPDLDDSLLNDLLKSRDEDDKQAAMALDDLLSNDDIQETRNPWLMEPEDLEPEAQKQSQARERTTEESKPPFDEFVVIKTSQEASGSKDPPPASSSTQPRTQVAATPTAANLEEQSVPDPPTPPTTAETIVQQEPSATTLSLARKGEHVTATATSGDAVEGMAAAAKSTEQSVKHVATATATSGDNAVEGIAAATRGTEQSGNHVATATATSGNNAVERREAATRGTEQSGNRVATATATSGDNAVERIAAALRGTEQSGNQATNPAEGRAPKQSRGSAETGNAAVPPMAHIDILQGIQEDPSVLEQDSNLEEGGRLWAAASREAKEKLSKQATPVRPRLPEIFNERTRSRADVDAFVTPRTPISPANSARE